MRKSNSYSQDIDGGNIDMDDWQYEIEDDWDEENSIHARKDHQNHRGRGKVQTRRSIEDFKEQKLLKELLGDDFEY
ncbi:PA3496 family putative envelope integrity protein [Psychromonas sp. PT13]|uniref:PA3496 family putative envelope integrity protein n=1 Tax=Psychromonas sp. PT13 TaxID=3439547 RepID=UPI003EBEBB36